MAVYREEEEEEEGGRGGPLVFPAICPKEDIFGQR